VSRLTNFWSRPPTALLIPLRGQCRRTASAHCMAVRHHSHHTKYENHTPVSFVFLQPAFGWLHIIILHSLQVHRTGGDDQEFYLRSRHGYHDYQEWRIHLASQRQPDQCDDGGETMMPKKSPEPTAVTAAVASHAASRRWLSFLR